MRPSDTRASEARPEAVGADEQRVLCVAIGVIGLRAIESVFGRQTTDDVISRLWDQLGDVCGPGTVIEQLAPDRVVVVTVSSSDDATAVNRLLTSARQPMPSPIGELVVGCAAGAATGRRNHRHDVVARAERYLSTAIERGPDAVEWGRRARAVNRARRQARSSAAAATTTVRSRPPGTTGPSAGSERGGTPTSGRDRRVR